VDRKVDRPAETSPDDRIAALVRAIDRATAAEQWPIVERLAAQLDRLTASSAPPPSEPARRDDGNVIRPAFGGRR
jgi:hypothetical protein